MAHLELPAIADALVADRDLDGTFETALDSGTSITAADRDAASAAAGTGTVTALGYQEFALDTDPLALTVSIQSDSISEAGGAGATTVVVTRNGDLSGPLTVTLSSSDTSEATVSSPITIPALAPSAEVAIDAVDDSRVDGTQTVTITASATGFIDGSDTVDVTDDDTAGVTVSPLSGLVTTESGGADQFTLVLDSEPTADVTIDLTSADLGEGTVSPSTVTFTPGTWDVPKTITVTGVDDVIADGDQTYSVLTGLASSADLDYGSAADPIVVDDVERGEFIANGSNLGGADYVVIGEHYTNGEIRGFLTFDLAGVTIPVVGASLSLQVDYYNSTSSLDFSVYDYVLGNDAALGTSMISIDAFNDLGSGQVYGSASINSYTNPIGSTFTVPLSAAAVADVNSKAGGLFTVGFADDLITGGNSANIRLDRDPSLRVNQLVLWTDRPGIDPPDVSLTNQDNDSPTLTVSVMADSVPENAGIEATAVTVSRNTDTTTDLVVDLASNDTSEAAVPATATIPAGHNRVTVFLDAVDDSDADGPQTVTITASATGFTSGADSLIVTDVESDPVGDWVWYDADADGVQDAGEPGVAGAVVELFETSDAIVGNADDVSRGVDITDSLGHYQLAGLTDGLRYYLVFRAPIGYSFTTQDAGSDDAVDSDANGAGVSAMFVHAAGQNQLGWDAGLVGGPPEFGFAGRAGGPLDDNASALETDAAGNVYVTGALRETVDFDLGPGVYEVRSCSTDDVYAAKYTPQGALIWARGVNGSGTDASYGLAVTDSADVIVTGTFQETADFDPGAGTYELTSAGANDVFVWKLDSFGDLLWARAMGGPVNDLGRSVAVTPDGGIVVTGEFLGTADFDPGPGVYTLTNSSSTYYYDAFLTRLDAAGHFVWARRLGGSSYDRGYAVAVGSDGSVFSTGVFQGTVDFDPGTGTHLLSSTGSYDAYLWKLNAAGDFLWAKNWGGTGSDGAYEIAIGADGSLFAAGLFRNTADFDPGGGTFELTAAGTQDAYVSKLDHVGQFLWAKSWGGTGYMQLGDMKLAADESLYFTGYFPGTADFDPGDDSLLRTSAGSSDVYVNVLDHTGSLMWAQTFGGAGDDRGNGVAVATDGGVFVGGLFPETADFDPRASVFELNTHSAEDLFLARLLPPLAPTAVQLLEDRVLEDQPAGTPVGALAGVDPDAGETFTFRLASGTGDTDNGSFRVDDGWLWTDEVFDYETKSSYSIRVRATDSSGLWIEQPLTVNVLPIAQAASIGDLVWEDANEDGLQDAGETGFAGVVVEAFSTDDGMLRGETVTDANGLYTLGGLLPGVSYHAVFRLPADYTFTVADAGADDTIDSDADSLGRTGSVFMVAGQSVDTLDAGLIPTHHPPTGVWLTQDRILEQQPVGTAVGNLVGVDPDPSETFVFELVPGPGDDDNAAFTLDGNVLRVAAVFDHDLKQTYNLRVRVTDSIGMSFEQPMTVSVVDLAQAAAIGDLVWDDQNGNGIQDAGEPGLGGVPVQAFSSADGLLRGATITDANGNYAIGGLLPDASYELQFRPPIGFNFTSTDVGGDDALDSDADALGITSPVALSPGASVVEVDAGLTGAPPWFGWAFGTGSGALNVNRTDEGQAVVTDSAGNVYMTGAFQETVDFDPGPGTYELTSEGSTDAVVAKYSSHGALIWALRFGGPGGEVGTALALVPGGGVYVAGEFAGTVDFDPGPGVVSLTGAGGKDVFVCRLDADGRLIWARGMGGSSADRATGIDVGADGSLAVAGYFAGTADFDPGPGSLSLTSAGYDDVFVAKLTDAGSLAWAHRMGGTRYDRAYDVAVAVDGSVYTTGSFELTVDFDPGAGTHELTSLGGSDVFVSRLNAAGQYVWAGQFGGTGSDTGLAVSVASDGSAVAAGYFSDTVDFDPGSGTYSLTSAGGIDAYITRLDNTGNLIWARQIGGLDAEVVDALALSADGEVYLAGYSTGVADFDPGPATFYLSDIDSGRDFVANLDAAGEFHWARRVPARRLVGTTGIAVDAAGDVLLTGPFSGTADFEPGSGSFTATANDYQDLFLWKLHPPLAPTAISLSEDRVLEHQPPGTTVGSLSATDPEPGEVFNYQLVAGTGDGDNGDFQVNGDVLLTAAEFDFATKATYSIRVRVTDLAGRWYEQPLTIHVQNASTAASVGDRVWSDVNGDGIQDAGEPGVGGAVVEIRSADDDLPRGVAVTDASGDYTLGGLLPAASYYLQFRPPVGYDFTAQDVGSDDAVDSDAGADGKTGSFTLSAGDNLTGWDAGLTGEAPAFGFALSAGDVNTDYANAVALDSDGSAYVTGTFRGTVDFDPGPGVAEFSTSGTTQGGFIAKYTAGGALVWAAHLEGTGSVYGQAVHVGDDGHVYLTGSYIGDLTYRLGSAVTRLDGAGSQDIFVAKLDSAGRPLWLKGFVGGSGAGREIVAGADGSVYTVGSISSTIDFDPGPGTFNLSYVPSYSDVFISKLDANGDFVWAKLIAGSFVEATGVGLASDGSLYLGGSFRGTVDFDPGSGVFNLSSTHSSYTDAYITKLDSAGSFAWVRRTSGTRSESCRSMTVAEDGSAIAAGSFRYGADFDPGDGEFILSAGSESDGFLWKLDAAGDFVWAKQFAGGAYVYGHDVELGSDGSVFLTGDYSSTVDVDPGPDTFLLESEGGYDTFVAKLDSSGNLQWAQSFGVDDTYDMALAPDETVYTAGALEEPNPDFDPRGGEYRLTNAGVRDVFVACHRPPSAPTAVTLPANRVFEHQPIDTVVGGLQGADPDAGEQFTFELVSGAGDADNAAFTINDGLLVTAAEFDALTKDTYAIRVQATDLSGLKVQAPLTVHVVPLSDAGTIAGRLWIDADQDGLRDNDEPPVPSAVAELRTAGDQIARDTVVIDVDGQYTFSGVVPSVDYVVTFRVPVGYAYTVANAGTDDTIDSDADSQGVTHTFSPAPAQTIGGVDAGLVGTPLSFGFALGIGSELDDEGKVVATDAAGNVYVTGTFRGAADFDPGPGETILSGVGTSDVFVAKYTRLGVLVWAKQIAGSSYLYARGLVVAQNGDLALAGSYRGTVDFDPGPGELLFESAAAATFVVRLDTDGDLVWARSLAADVPNDLATDSDGALFVAGRFSGTDDFDPGPGTFTLTSAGATDAYIAKLDEAGELVWARAYGGTDDEYTEQIAVDDNGSIYLTGYFEGTADFDPGPCACSLVSAGYGDIFILRLDSSGGLVWAGGIGGTAYDYGRAIAVSDDGSVYGSGQFNSTVDFDPGPDLFPLQTHGHYDIPIVRLDSAGSFVSAGQLGGPNWDQAYDLTVDPDGNLVGVGGFKDVADFDPGATDILLTSAGEFDVVVFRLDSEGAGISADRFGGPGDDLGYGVHVTPDGSVYATGYFSDTADFDPGAGVFALTSSGDRDAFLVKLTSNRPPLGLALSNSTALADSPAGTLVGYFSTTDLNWEDSFTYTLVPGAGDTDNAAFQIVGRKLQTSAAFGGKSSYNIRVRSTDRDGQWFEATFVVTVAAVVDVPPEVESVVRADVNPTNAPTVDYTVTFTEPVTGVSTDDFVLVTNGIAGAAVTSVAGSGTTYTVTVDSGTGDGTLRLDVGDDDTILDAASQPLGGTGLDNGRFVPGETYTLERTPPQVVSIERVGVSPTNASTVDFTVTFSEPVSGVDAADFHLETTGLAGLSIVDITNDGPVYTVTVNTGTGDGTLRLDVDDDDSITDAVGNPLGGPGVDNGDYTSGPIYTFDRTPPVVQSIVRAGASPTDAPEVTFTVTFSESVTGVDTSDFELTTTALPGAAVTGVSGSGDTWTVTASTGLGNGTIRLDVVDNDSILDAVGNPLGGTGAGNGDYTGGETYVIERLGAIFGRKWDDRDGDGYWDPAEPGLAGVTIFLDLDNDGTLDAGEPSAITQADDPGTTGVDETGQYRFEDLAAGTYSVTEVTPTGWEQTYPFLRTGATGQLTSSQVVWDNLDGVDGLDEAAGVAVSPDGNHIYVAAYTDDALTVFERDPQTGQATFLQTLKDGVAGVDGLDGAQSVVVSSDGKHVYVASPLDNSLAVFTRDPIAGTVTFVESHRDGVGGVDGLEFAISVALSHDGAHVYVAGGYDDAVALFSRNSDTGQLTYLQNFKDDTGSIDGLDGPFSIAVSPDDAHVYVGAQVDDALVAFERNTTTGALTFIEREKDGDGGVDGLNAASGVALSPDGKHVYVAGHDDDRVAVFSRNASDGTLAYVQSVYSGTTLDGVISVSLSPHGNHLYTASEISDTVNVYSRNTSTGTLTFVESFKDGTSGIDGLDWVWHTTVSPDGKNVYAVGAADDTLVTFSRDAGTVQPQPYTVALSSGEAAGPLDFANANDAPLVTAITRLDPTPTGASSVRFAVTFSEVVTGVDSGDFEFGPGAPGGAAITSVSGSGTDYTVTVNTGSGDGTLRLDLTDNDSIIDNGNRPLGGVGTGDGDFTGETYTIDRVAPLVGSIKCADANPTSADVVHFTVSFTGGPVSGVDAGDFLLTTTGTSGAAITGVSGSGSVYTVAVSTGIGNGTIRLDVNDNDTIIDSVGNPLGGTGPGNGDFTYGEIYTIERTPTGVIRGTKWHDLDGDHRRDPDEPGLADVTVYLDLNQNGQLDAGEPSTVTQPDDPGTPGVDETGAYEFIGVAAGTYTVAEVVPGGYVQTAPLVFSGGTGELSFIGLISDFEIGVDELNGAHDVALSPDGAHLYVASRLDNAVVAFARHPVSGQLTFVQAVKDGLGGVDGLDFASTVVVSPDGRHVYAAGTSDNAVAVFSRDGATGGLTFVEVVKDGVGGVIGVRGAAGLAFDPDGNHLYVAGNSDNALTVFARNPAAGTLTFVGMAEDGVGGVDGLAGAVSVVVSPDGNHVYATGENDNALAVFERNSSTGLLTFAQVLVDNQGGVNGLDGPFSMTISPDGAHVYAAANHEDALSVFSRNAATGQLTFVEVVINGQNGVEGMDGPWDVAVSPDGTYVYAAGAYDDAVVVFQRDPTGGNLTFVQKLQDGQGAVAGLRYPHSVAPSPDGTHVYAAAYDSDSVVVFRRDPGTPIPGPHTAEVDLAQIVEGVDFGNRQAIGEIRGVKWNDLDGDGVKDSGEPLLEGATVYLDVNNNGQFDAGEPSAVTDQDGEYAFTGLEPGVYTVAEVVQTGWQQTSPDPTLGGIERVMGAGQAEPNLDTGVPALSHDGRYVAFASVATNIMPGDANGFVDVYLWDRQTGTMERISLGPGGVEPNGASTAPAISGDARYVAFLSDATNLVTSDTNGVRDVFVLDRQTGALELASVDSDEAQANAECTEFTLSADGRFVAFTSAATNLVLGDTNNVSDVFVRDLAAGTTERVSIADGESQADAFSSDPAISADGRYVAFMSEAGNLVSGDTNGRIDVFVRDRQMETTERVSVASDGTQTLNSSSTYPSISGDGRYVAFASWSSNLVSDDANGQADIFVRDRQLGWTERVSLAPDGTEANGYSIFPVLSQDGRQVAFVSTADNLVPDDLTPQIDLFVVDRALSTVRQANVGTDGSQADQPMYLYRPAISGDGAWTAFMSEADNLVPDDANGVLDAFLIPSTAPLAGTHAVTLAVGQAVLDVDFGNAGLLDFGDAPDTGAGTGPGNYHTLSASGGPAHTTVANIKMGANLDAELDAFPSAAADGDDLHGTPNDEDGLVDPAGDLDLLVGDTPAVGVKVTNNTGAAATLYGWIDYNADGVFDNASERTSIAVPDGSSDATVTLTFPAVPPGFVGLTYARFRLSTDAAAADPTGAAGDGEVEDYPAEVHATVVDGHRYIFYDNSYWDGNVAGPNTTGGPGGNGDDGAIASDKSALLPGEAATAANFTTYDKGINGIMVDVAGLANPTAVGDGDFSEFAFKVGNDNTPIAWPDAPAPTDVDVRDLGGGVHRVSFFWAAGAIPTRNWLQLTLKAGATTGLAQPDVFYFGNAIGDANLDCKTLYDDIFAIYSGVDFVNFKPITEPCDVNRDGKVLYDDIFACYSCVDFTNSLILIAPPVPPSAPAAGSATPVSGELLWAAHLAALDELDRRSDDSEEEDRETAADAVFAAYGDE